MGRPAKWSAWGKQFRSTGILASPTLTGRDGDSDGKWQKPFIHDNCYQATDRLSRLSVSAAITLLLVSGLLVPVGAQTDSEDEPGWANLNPDPRPQPLSSHAMTFDSGADRVILFGGSGPNGVTNGTWSYDFNKNAWVDLSPVRGPPARNRHALAYDVESERVILYGGNLGTRAGEGRADTWAFDYNMNTWTNVTPDLSPPRRDVHALAYDEESDRVILFGGMEPPGFLLNDTWAYDTNTNSWTEMDPVIRPAVRRSHTLAYDAESDRVVLFGGAPTASSARAPGATTSTPTRGLR